MYAGPRKYRNPAPVSASANEIRATKPPLVEPLFETSLAGAKRDMLFVFLTELKPLKSYTSDPSTVSLQLCRPT